MADRRFDSRSKETFKKDIYFGTKLEKYWFDRFLHQCDIREDIELYSHADNGVDNDGGFIASGKTVGADYRVTIEYQDRMHEILPLEMKWVPNGKKFTLKTGDVKGYLREEAAILFVWNTNSKADLRKPKDYDFEKHVQRIVDNNEYMRWGIVLPNDLQRMSNDYESEVKPIFYMGNKPGFVIYQENFQEYLTVERFV